MAASKLSRFQGSLVGGVVGDCIGAVFEGGWFERVEIEDVLKVTRKIQSGTAFVFQERLYRRGRKLRSETFADMVLTKRKEFQ